MKSKHRVHTTDESGYTEPAFNSNPNGATTTTGATQGKVAKTLASVIDGRFLSNQAVIKQLPFVLFIVFLAVLYIANAYYAERNIRRASKVTKEIEELHSEYLSVSAKVTAKTQLSNITLEAEKLGLRQSLNPPAKLIVKTTSTPNKN